MRLHIQARIKNRYLSFTTFVALCARLFSGITRKNKCCSIELHTSILLLTQQSAKQQLRATNGANRKVNIELHSRIYQRSCAYISVLYAFSFLFVRAWRQVRSARDPSFCQKKNVFERFERMRLEIKKNVENKNNNGETKRIGPREGGREQREKQEGREKSDENRGELRVSRGYVDASFIPDAIVRFSLVVLCHHSSRLTICPASGFTSLWIYRLSFFPWSCSRRLIAPPLADGERARPLPKKPSLEQYFRTDRRASLT